MEFYALWVASLLPDPAFLSSEPRQQRQRTVTGKQHCVTVRIGLGHDPPQQVARATQCLAFPRLVIDLGRTAFGVMLRGQFAAQFRDQ